MYKKEDQDAYYLHKLLIATIFSKNSKFYKDIPWIFSIDSLNVLGQIISFYSEQNCFDKDIKDNIYQLLLSAREIKDDKYLERIDIINQIISKLNTSKDESIWFYVNELYYRREIKDFSKYTEEDIKAQIPDINNSIVNDFLVIHTHSNRVSDDEFVENYLEYFANNILYYESLNVILEECPSLFEDELFCDRVRFIFECNKTINKKNNTLNKKMIKKICKVNS